MSNEYLNYDFEEEMTLEQEQELDNFFEDNLDSFIHPYGECLNDDEFYGSQLIWDNFRDARLKEVANQDGVYIYTVLECDNEEAWLVEGWHFVNRLGYFFTTKKIDMPEEGIRYW